MTDRIPVHRPKLPALPAISPYIRRIDAARWYSNNGPLAKELESRLAAKAGLPASNVLVTSSCTSAITACLRVLAPGGGQCLMPSFTFPATAGAAVQAGLLPSFADVDMTGWQLTPDIAGDAIMETGDRIAAVVAVSPFGAPIDIQGWVDFATARKLPVVIDAAAAADAVLSRRMAPEIPICISLHATKMLGCGEGGAIFLPDGAPVRDIRAAVNFGFSGERSARLPGFNGKMSEYHAAIGHAALDEWAMTRAAFTGRASIGRGARASAGLGALRLQEGFGLTWTSTSLVVDLGTPRAREIALSFDRRGIETRRWWEDGCHRQPAYADMPRTSLESTDRLAARLLGLPFFIDIEPAAIERITGALARELTG
ncbi:MAG: DegT/DnrJ/EryC1/StrS family aminotransferase [Rhodospirillales bacterium]